MFVLVRLLADGTNNIVRENVKRYMEICPKGYKTMTVNSLAKETGMAKSTLTAFLNGKIDGLTAGKIGIISDALRVPIEKLYLPHGMDTTYEEGMEDTEI